MRVISFVLGGLLLVAGAGAVVVADRMRQDTVEQAQARLDDALDRRDAAREANRDLVGVLAQLRAAIADQEEQLADTEGFLK